MADISWARRMDAVTGGAMILTVDAVVFLMTALIGAPFVLFFMADGDDPAVAIWPLTTVWVVSAALGSAAAATAFLIGASGTSRIRRAGAATALATAVATVGLVATSVSSSPVLAAVSALFAAANLGAARLLFRPEPADAAAIAPALPEAFLLAAPLAEAEVRTRDTLEIDLGKRRDEDAPETADDDAPEATTDDDAETTPEARADVDAPANTWAESDNDATPESDGDDLDPEAAFDEDDEDLEPVFLIRNRHPRGQAALRSLGGIKLPPRARRPRSVRD